MDGLSRVTAPCSFSLAVRRMQRSQPRLCHRPVQETALLHSLLCARPYWGGPVTGPRCGGCLLSFRETERCCSRDMAEPGLGGGAHILHALLGPWSRADTAWTFCK